MSSQIFISFSGMFVRIVILLVLASLGLLSLAQHCQQTLLRRDDAHRLLPVLSVTPPGAKSGLNFLEFELQPFNNGRTPLGFAAIFLTKFCQVAIRRLYRYLIVVPWNVFSRVPALNHGDKMGRAGHKF